MTGRMRLPTRSIYASKKSFLERFYEVLGREYKNKIDFTTLEIGVTSTEMANFNARPKIDSDELAKSAMKFLGKYKFTTGYLNHEILQVSFWKVPFVKKRARNKNN